MIIYFMPSTADKVVIGTSATGGVIAAGCGTLKLLGFKAAGIAASSIASGVQAGIGNVAAGSAFSIAQSVGTSAVVTVGLTGGLVIVAGGVTYWGVKTYMNRKSKI